MVVWVAVDEGIAGEIVPEDGLSLVGVYRTKDKAFEDIKLYCDTGVKWDRVNPGYYKGYGANNRRYVVISEEVE